MLARILFPNATHVPLEQRADAKLLIGDAALRSAFEDPTPHHDLGRIWTERTGLPMVFAVWACGDPPPDGVEELEDALVASVRQARSEPEVLAHEAMDRYGYPAGFLARYFEKLRYRFGPRERAALFTFLELARDAGELDRVPEPQVRLRRGGARVRWLLLGAGVLLPAVACGEEQHRTYSYAKSSGLLSKASARRQTLGAQGQTVVRITDGTKFFDLLFLPSGASAKAYTKHFKVPSGILHTKGNVIVYGHQTGGRRA